MILTIFAGGLGTRLAEETNKIPKPLVEIGGMPIIWHIMKYYSYYGINNFVICCGYKGYMIKQFFNNYSLHCYDAIFDFKKDKVTYKKNKNENWKVTCIDTGLETMTGGRLNKVKHIINKDKDNNFLLTYGDGLCNVNINNLITFHNYHKKIGTVTAIQMESKFGNLILENDKVINFKEKKINEYAWINGGFFVFNKNIFNYLKNDDSMVFEKEPLEKLVDHDQLRAYKHYGKWKCMDTLKDKGELQEMWDNNKAFWKNW